MSDLPSTNDPIPSERKVALLSVYQAHPLLNLLLENAQKAKARDETAVSVFEHDGNGNCRMVDTRPAELRPPPEHADKRLHWVSDPFGQRCVWEWVVGKWFIPGVADLLEPSCEDLPTYRYLGPAEWRDEAAQAAVDAMMSSRHVEDLAALEDAAVRIASLESQLTAAAALQTGGDAGEYWAETWHKCNLESEAAVCRSRELEAQNARLLNENAMLRAHPPLSRIPNGGLYQWDTDAGRWVEAPTSDAATVADKPPPQATAKPLPPRALGFGTLKPHG
jgi:hypothetical protein